MMVRMIGMGVIVRTCHKVQSFCENPTQPYRKP
jgi:hypothetical protein